MVSDRKDHETAGVFSEQWFVLHAQGSSHLGFLLGQKGMEMLSASEPYEIAKFSS